jgi:ATP-dependent DNA helicase RecG
VSRRGSILSEAEIRALLGREEGQFLEFKSLWDLQGAKPKALPRRKVRDLIAKVAAAFANADGGTLILGVEDDGSPTGHGYSDEVVLEFLAVPEQRLRAAVPCRTQRVTIDDHELIVFEVPMSNEATMLEGDGFPYRIGDQNQHEPQEVINARKRAYRTVGYERRLRSEASVDDLDLELVERFFEGSHLEGRTPLECLERFGLIHARASGGDWGITNAALLLFAKSPVTHWHPRAGLRFFRVKGTERLHGSRRNVTQGARVELPLAEAIAESHRLAREQIGRSEKLHDLFFREIPEYPGFAWQEAIINAFGHRDYEVQGQEIEVWFYSDRMEVRSPGGLVPPVTLEALRAKRPVHASRNPMIVRVLTEGGLMREEGEGVPRMFDEMTESFLKAPSFDLEDGTFTVTLRNEPIFSGPSLEWKTLVDELPVGVSQKRALLAHPEGFTNGDYQTLNQVDRDEAYRQIQEMIVQGVIQAAEKPGRGAFYRISEDLLQRRNFLVERLPALRTHFASHKQLKNADYRELFGLTRYASVRELKLLVDQGYLRLEGERRGAHYLPLSSLAVGEE